MSHMEGTALRCRYFNISNYKAVFVSFFITDHCFPNSNRESLPPLDASGEPSALSCSNT